VRNPQRRSPARRTPAQTDFKLIWNSLDSVGLLQHHLARLYSDLPTIAAQRL
jgi:hypothetical protein